MWYVTSSDSKFIYYIIIITTHAYNKHQINYLTTTYSILSDSPSILIPIFSFNNECIEILIFRIILIYSDTGYRPNIELGTSKI